MKNTALLITTLLFSFIISSQGQSLDELAEIAGDGFCSCVNETYDDIDKDVKRAMARIIKYQIKEDEAGMENYMTKLPADLMVRIEEQAGLFEENEEAFQMCLDDMDEEMEELSFDEEKYEGLTEEAFLVMMIKSMKETTDCEFAGTLMELGLEIEAEENENQVTVDPVKPKTSTKGSSSNKYEGTGGN